MSQLVNIENVSRVFGKIRAVDSVSLDVAKGDFLTIVGPSGCGKTTLLRMIAGFDTPTEGRIRIAGQPVENVPPHKRSIGMVFQKLALFPHMTTAENVAYPLKMRRFDPATIPGLVKQYLELVRLGGYEARYPHELSGGQQQRVAIARALSFSPDLLLLDEPLSALDKKLREEMQLEFRRIQQQLQVTTINVTHDQREALVMSDRIVVMNDGAVQQAGTPVEMYRKPANRFVADFIGMTSVFQGIIAKKGVNGEVVVRVGKTTLRAQGDDAALADGMPVDCAIRAEQIRILDERGASCENEIAATIEQRIFEGDRILYLVRPEGMGEVRLRLFDHDPAAHREYSENDRVKLGWNARDQFAYPVGQR
ncbi:MAG TPA: ABC transporter ATP-binding protein [Rhodobacteraceae bacterium]|nr:ABC transporter ATP-binding protein [Paracoccaceae bacterium]